MLGSPSEGDVVSDTPSEIVDEGMAVILVLIVVCVNPLKIFYFTGV